MDFIDELNEKRTKELLKLNIQPGNFVNFNSEFGDVWHEVERVFDDSVKYASVYTYTNRKDRNPVEMAFFYEIRKVVKHASDIMTCSVFECKEGSFSYRQNNLHLIPEKYRKES